MIGRYGAASLGVVAAVFAMGAVWSAASARADAPAFTVVAVMHDERAFGGAHDVELQGRYAFVCGKQGSAAIVDIDDPAQPRLVWSMHDAEVLNDAETVLPAGHHLYLGTRDFLTLDIRHPPQTKIAAKLVDRSQIDRINGLVRRGNHLFAANKEGRIDLFDVASPTRPMLVGSRDVDARDGIGKPHDIDWLGDLLIVVDPAGFGRRDDPGTVALYRVFDEAKQVLPPEQWSCVGKAASLQMVGGNRVRTRGDFAFVAASISPQATSRSQRQACLAIVDCTNRRRPEFVTALPFADERGPNGMCVVGNAVFVCGGQTIMAVDVSRPREPKRLATFRATSLFRGEPGLDDGHDLVYRDGYLFVTAQTSHGFGIVRVDDPHIRAAADARP